MIKKDEADDITNLTFSRELQHKGMKLPAREEKEDEQRNQKPMH